jgi:hypothetical protein
MQWNLSPVETAGVVGVGLGLGWLGCGLTSNANTTSSQRAACIVGGAALYTGGVVIGTNRPKKGYLSMAKKRKKKGKGRKRK